jgi:hypothetical protein
MQANSQIKAFVAEWMAGNVSNKRNPSHTAADIDRLAAGLTGAARAHGISGGDLHRLLGDIDDYLIVQCRQSSSALLPSQSASNCSPIVPLAIAAPKC